MVRKQFLCAMVFMIAISTGKKVADYHNHLNSISIYEKFTNSGLPKITDSLSTFCPIIACYLGEHFVFIINLWKK